jgi:hypothetical protein
MIMQNSLKTGLIIAGLVLIGFGLFTVYSTNTEINTRPIQLMKIVAFFGGLLYKKK